MAGIKLGIISLATINVIAVFDLTGIAAQAEYGLSAIFYYLFAALFFLVPIAFVAAELATSWPEQGGVFRWVGEAFGPRWGFVAIFLQWGNCTIFFPTMLTFAWVSLAYINPNLTLDAALASNRADTVIAILLIFWLAVVATMRGIKTSSTISVACGLVGTIIPGLILILLGFLYLGQGNPVQIKLGLEQLIPQFTGFSSLVLATAVFLDYAGIEMSAVHIRDTANPQKNYPLATAVSAIFIVTIFILTTLALSLIIPVAKINLTQSLLIAFDDFFHFYGIPWAGPLVACALVLGIIGQLTVWLAGPSSALVVIGRAGYLPPWFHQLNRHNVPGHILLLQGLIVTFLVIAFAILPTVQAVFQILTQLASSVYLIIYILMFSACIYLRYTQPNIKRPFKIPGGKVGLWLCAGTGLLSSIAAFFISLFPPAQIIIGSPEVYLAILLTGTILFVSTPLIIYALRKPCWDAHDTSARLEPFGEKAHARL
ncbi:MAG: putative glutamine/gamma-aminobutyrate antiporter GadC [Burkholderiaceae bacterium]